MDIKDYGDCLDSVTVEAGLSDLCPGIHFDMGGKLNLDHPYIESRQGVFYQGRHICSMDRGMIPEFKVWTVKDDWIDCSIGEADMEGVKCLWYVVPTGTPGYREMYEDARRGLFDEMYIRNDGALIRLTAKKMAKVKGRVLTIGWRTTFEALVRAGVPGITRESLGAKFGVNMHKYPVGSPEEVHETLAAD